MIVMGGTDQLMVPFITDLLLFTNNLVFLSVAARRSHPHTNLHNTLGLNIARESFLMLF